jgi:uncharacterized protein (DUF433 family)
VRGRGDRLGKIGGPWACRDTRLPVATIIEVLEDPPIETVMEPFDVTREQIRPVLNVEARSLAPADAHPV